MLKLYYYRLTLMGDKKRKKIKRSIDTQCFEVKFLHNSGINIYFSTLIFLLRFLSLSCFYAINIMEFLLKQTLITHDEKMLFINQRLLN